VAEKPEEVDLLGQLTVDLDAEYTLRPSRQAISNIEKALGKALPQLTVQCGSLALSVEELGICIAELMKAYAVFDPNAGTVYKAPNPEKIADLIYEHGPVDAARRLAIIFTGALTGGYTAAGEPKAAGMMTEPTLTAA
jgi:hypothetical protein